MELQNGVAKRRWKSESFIKIADLVSQVSYANSIRRRGARVYYSSENTIKKFYLVSSLLFIYFCSSGHRSFVFVSKFIAVKVHQFDKQSWQKF